MEVVNKSAFFPPLEMEVVNKSAYFFFAGQYILVDTVKRLHLEGRRRKCQVYMQFPNDNVLDSSGTRHVILAVGDWVRGDRYIKSTFLTKCKCCVGIKEASSKQDGFLLVPPEVF